MKIKNLLRKKIGDKYLVNAPEIKIGKYWTFESGTYVYRKNGKSKKTNDFYLGLRFKIGW